MPSAACIAEDDHLLESTGEFPYCKLITSPLGWVSTRRRSIERLMYIWGRRMSYNDHGSIDRPVHPEGKLYDPEGYNSYQRLRMIWGFVIAVPFFGIFIFGGLAILQNPEAISGFIACFILVFIILIPMGIMLKTSRDNHLNNVVAEKDRRHRTVEENIVHANSQLTEISSQPKVKTVINNVTLNFSDGSSFTGPFAVGENVRVSYIAASETKDAAIRSALEDLVKEATKLVERLEDNNQKTAASSQLKMLVEEAKKPTPDRWTLDVSSKGLIDAAKTVAELTVPVTAAIRTVLSLFGC